MELALLISFMVYFSFICLIVFFAYQKNLDEGEQTNLSLNYWVTALTAHASDMGSWLFMGFPAMVYANGMIEVWTALGLILFMFFNWQFIAPGLREKAILYKSPTLALFFEKHFEDPTHAMRIISAFFSLIYFTFYISAGLVALGYIFDAVFSLNYQTGITIAVLIIFYTLLGGMRSISWIDFFQGIFLLIAIIALPIMAFNLTGGLPDILSHAKLNGISLKLIPNFSLLTFQTITYNFLGWGLGYFGQPHIVTKFITINTSENIRKAKWVGTSWQIISMTSAACMGLVGIAYFTNGLENNELIFVTMTKSLFHPFVGGLILCAMLTESINIMSSQVLASSDIIVSDLWNMVTSSQETTHKTYNLRWIARLSVILICGLAYSIASLNNDSSIYDLVYYAWSGLGGTFGPLMLASLHSSLKNRHAAYAGIIVGGTTAGLWPFINESIPALFVAFLLSFVAMFIVEKIYNKSNPTQEKEQEAQKHS